MTPRPDSVTPLPWSSLTCLFATRDHVETDVDVVLVLIFLFLYAVCAWVGVVCVCVRVCVWVWVRGLCVLGGCVGVCVCVHGFLSHWV